MYVYYHIKFEKYTFNQLYSVYGKHNFKYKFSITTIGIYAQHINQTYLILYLNNITQVTFKVFCQVQPYSLFLNLINIFCL